ALRARGAGRGVWNAGDRLEEARGDRSALLPADRGRSPARRRRQGAARARLEAEGDLQAAHRDDGQSRRGGRPPHAGRPRPERLASIPRPWVTGEEGEGGRSRWCWARRACWAARSAGRCQLRGGTWWRRRTPTVTSG